MLRAFGLGVTLYGFWLLLSGHYTPLLLTLGVLSCALVTWLSMRAESVDSEIISRVHFNLAFWLYVPWLMKEIFIANLAVAKIILDPKLPISPSMVLFHGSQKTDVGKALYANSITLTPGTITTGIEGQAFEIHALTTADLETDEENQMNVRCTRVEGSR